MKASSFIILLIFNGLLLAQTYNVNVDVINIYDGLAVNRVNCFAFDSDDNLWIATTDGLSVYDGFEVKNFNASNSMMASDNVVNLFRYRDGKMAFFTYAGGPKSDVTGLCTVSYDDGVKFLEHQQFLEKEGLGPMHSYAWEGYHHDGFYLRGYDGGMYSYNITEERWVRIALPDGFKVTYTRAGYVIGEYKDSIRFFRGEESDVMYDLEDLKAVFPHVGRVWPYLEELRMDLTTVISNATYDSLRQVTWIGSGNQLFGINQAGNRVRFSDGKDYYPLAMTLRFAPVIMPDGSIVLASTRGLYVLRVERSLFHTFDVHSDFGDDTEFPTSSCRGLGVKDGMLYVADNDVLYRVPVYDPGETEILIPGQYGNFYPLLFRDDRIVTGRSSLYSVDPVVKQVKVIADSIISAYSSFWSAFFNGNDLYLGSEKGVVVLDFPALLRGKEEVICADTELTSQRYIYQYAQLDDERLFVVTSDGLFILYHRECRLQQLHFLDEEGEPKRVIHFTHVDPDADSTWWVTTLDAGVINFGIADSVAHVMRTLDLDDRIVTNVTYASYADDLGYRWISTDQGLIRLRLDDWTFHTYTEEDGLPGNEFNRMSHTRDTAGNLYFGGLDGVVGFNPVDFPLVSNDIPLRLLDFKQHSGWFDTIVNRTAEVRASGMIDMRSSDRYVRLKVGLLDYFNTRDHRYSYLIEGIHDTWQPMNGNTLFISALPYGSHRLIIRGRNAIGVLSKNLLDLKVVVRYPFYLQWWFFLLTGLGVVLVLREIWIGKTRRMRKHSEALEAQVIERTQTITQQADELLKLQELRSRFFANISHELRTPLTLIKGPLASLLKKRNADEDKEYLELIQYNAELLHERIDDLLSLARADAGRLEVHTAPLKLHDFLDRLLDSHMGLARKKHIHLDLENHLPASTVVMMDRKKLGQVLSNFIGNAVKFSEPATVITMECSVVENKLQFCVADQGPGIPEDDIDKVFDRFFQVDKAHAEMGGTGIGLALAREFARVMDGRVWATSVTGEGSQFWLSLPYLPTEGAETDAPPEEVLVDPVMMAPVSADPSASRIMLVEDNRSMRAFLEKELGAFQIESHEHGQSALFALRELAQKQMLPGLVISDVMMPVMDGFALLQQIRNEPALSHLPVIMLTARAAHEDKMEALRIGVDDYITKPFITEELLVRIHNILSRIPGKREVRNTTGADTGKADDQWLRELEHAVKEHLRDSSFNLARLAEKFFISESTLHRRVKAATGLTPNMYLREVRLFEARRLLETGEFSTVAELSAAVGFETPDYFSRVYQQRFGYRPSEKL